MIYAGLWLRILGQILDYIMFCLVFFPVTYLVKGTWLMTPEDHLWIIFDPICGIFLIIIFAYFILLERYLGMTIGKLILGMKVLSEKGEKINIRQSLVRNFGRLIDGLPCFNLIGMISIHRSPAKQRMGDKFAGTVVVKTQGSGWASGRSYD